MTAFERGEAAAACESVALVRLLSELQPSLAELAKAIDRITEDLAMQGIREILQGLGIDDAHILEDLTASIAKRLRSPQWRAAALAQLVRGAS